MKKIMMIAAAAAMTVPAAPVLADPPPHAKAYGKRAKDRIYDDRGRYYEPRRLSRADRVWRGDDGRYYCKRDNGTTGLVIGAAVGALAGHEIAGRGDKTLGAIIGAVGGGLLGREIDKGDLKCR
ncbi:glycine zipper 2TM domain-containing protein [Altererythrobacter aurantiacus]|uniref:17 kDa surface antigen n=1 Tax=Parapontixanthobacter aurantiacus TaxID=1463599 RepID=A0A844ZAG1_9SPHN|nr:glycine zipper 2TM domain-containing protein [Parapontixanthobacter aurantiacus]MXO85551.1 glycine zipper 2TM domain-containing protein [Parapontixanthobacter aurantiacus]